MHQIPIYAGYKGISLWLANKPAPAAPEDEKTRKKREKQEKKAARGKILKVKK
jgi:hypothetical protein